jgi:YwiC-like protein
MTPDTGTGAAKERSRLAAVAVPTEHGGWGLTLEPALLGLLVAPSWAGIALAAAGLVTFLARTPVKYVLVDRWRHRRLARTVLAERVAAIELGVLAALVSVATVTAESPFWAPIAIALPLVAVELRFDMRSRSRRLLPELAGAIGIGSIAAAIVLADGDGWALAGALWCVVAARSVASIPFVRLQLARYKRQPARRLTSDAAQGAAVAVAIGAVALDPRTLAGLGAIAVLAVLQLWAARRRAPAASVLGVQQLVVGLTVVLVTALAVLAP